MSTLAKLLVSLGLDAGDYHKGLQDSAAETQNFSSSLMSVGTVAVAAGAVAGAALVGVGVAGVKAFGQFQTGMSEVFTLLPGLSASAMGDMSKDVKDFAKEFGVLPEKEIPALYQALSSGVPKDNVFDFLATAQKAAVGGVTDLTTAVDGISSAVNAYGPTVLSATQASDLMFTTVKLGKTNFEQLSSSLFNVLPTAAAAGVSFQDVSAALASITLQGTPVSVATTELRQALIEASKGGTKLSDAIKDVTGKSFPELIKSGSNIGEIFNKLRSSMPDQQFKDLFGSVEGLNAVLSITGPNAAGFAANLDAMKKSAGATELAYQTMNQTLGASANKLKAFGAVFLIDIGEKLAPAVALFTNALIGLLNSQFVTDMINSMGIAIQNMVTWIITASTTGIPALTNAFNIFQTVLGTVVALLTGNAATVQATLNALFGPDLGAQIAVVIAVINNYAQVWINLATTIYNVVSLLLGGDIAGAWNALITGLGSVITSYETYIASLYTLLSGVGTWLLTNLPNWGQALVDWVTPYIPGAIAALDTFIASVITWINTQPLIIANAIGAWAAPFINLVSTVTPQFLEKWPTLLNSFLQWIASAVGPILNQLGLWIVAFVSWLVPLIPSILTGLAAVLGAITAFIVSTAAVIISNVAQWGIAFLSWLEDNVLPKLPNELAAILAIFTGTFKAILMAIQAAADLIVGVITGLMQILQGNTAQGWATIQQSVLNFCAGVVLAFAQLGSTIVTAISNAVSNMINIWSGAIALLNSIMVKLTAMVIAELMNLASKAVSAGKAIVDGIIRGVQDAGGALFDALTNLATSALNAAKAAIHIGSPSKTFADEVGTPIVQGIVQGVTQNAGLLASSMMDLTGMAVTGAQSVVNGIGSVLSGSQLPAKASTLGQTIIDNIAKAFSTQTLTTMPTINTSAQSIIDNIGETWDKGDIVSQAKSVGSNAIKGVIAGIESKLGAAVSAAKSAGQKIVDAMAAHLDIHSPSGVFANEIGVPIVLGLIQGLDKTWPLLTHWLKGNMAKTVAEFLTSSATLVRGAYDIFKSLKDLQTSPPFQPLIDATDALKTAQDQALGVSSKLLDLNAEIATLTGTPLDQITDHVKYNEQLTALYAKQAILLQEQAQAQGNLAQLGQTQAQAQAQSVAQQQMINQIADQARQQYEAAQQQALAMMATDAKGALAFFNQRKAQIEEMAQLEKDRALATSDEERRSLDTQIQLLKAAQAAETTAQTVTAQIQINPSGQSDQKIIDIIARALKDAGINVDIRTRTA